MAERRANRWLAPGVVFGALLVLTVVQVLTSPPNEALETSPTLSSHSPLPYGARGFYDMVERLGWEASRRQAPFRETLDSSAVYVLLGGATPISRAEVHHVLDAVRRGARLLVIPGRHSTIADSLGVRASEFTYSASPGGPGGVGSKPEEEDDKGEEKSISPEKDGEAPDSVIRPATGTLPVDTLTTARDSSGAALALPHDPHIDPAELGVAARQLGTVRYYLEPLDSLKAARVPFPADTVSFVTTRVDEEIVPVIVGTPLGRGRIVMVADPYLFTNYTLRDGDAAVLLTRAMQWLAPRRAERVVFDEYHHQRPSVGMVRAVRHAMLETPLGRAALQMIVAAVLVVLMLGARPFAPRPIMRMERRSPFEHVGALSRAYEQIGATRLAARRLLQGLRRRHPIGRATMSNEEYLAALGTRYPDAANDVERLRTSLERALEPAEFLAVGEAVETIERKLHT